ncbi:DNA replicative helicase MCM subunit Mcm2, Cdc46/Mcm family [Halovenus aranensis]|uniref:DNA replicative helicase MCM subunit Mcm2, Cdc46/Mcm family n=1 Tax=Halovenus aranensis TaxID=890420 RepID=A0A1G8ZHP2_9EURY|nr:DNA replicative helicase MCM subunit Mcm2, Cdc46/Mcm family [Halovenus aranensis]
MTGTDNPVRQFREFYRRVESVSSEVDNDSLQKRSIIIDWEALAEFNADLADLLLDQPDATIGYAREALMMLGTERAPTGGLPQFRIRNLPTDMSPDELATVQLGQLVSISGMVVATTDVRPELLTIAAECQQCGAITKGRYFGLTTPNIECCWSCGQDEYVPITADSECVDTQRARLLIDSEGDTDLKTVHLRIEDDLQPVTPGTRVRVTGIVRPCQRTELNQQPSIDTRFIDCSDIVLQDGTPGRVPTETTWTLGDLAAQPTYLTGLANAVAPSVPGFWRAKLALALLYVEPTPFGSRTSQGGPNILLLAPESSHRRRVLEAFGELDRGVQYQSLTQTESPPVVAQVQKRASRWWVETGPLVQSSGSIAAVDGLEHVAETQHPLLLPALTETQIRLAKAGIEISLNTCNQLVATAAPTTEPPENLRSAAPLDRDIVEIFDLHLSDSATATTIHSEFTRAWTEHNTVAASRDVIHDRPDVEVYRSVLTQARLLAQPEIEDAAQEQLHESDYDPEVVAWVATALTRLCGQQCVRPIDIDIAERIALIISAV